MGWRGERAGPLNESLAEPSTIYAVNRRGCNSRQLQSTSKLWSAETYLCRSQVKGATPLRNRCRIGGAAVASPRGSKSFARLDAIVSLRSYSRGQAKSRQDWRGAENIGRWRGTSTMVRAERALTWTAVLGRGPSDRLVRSSQGVCYGHWPRRQLGASPLDSVRGTEPAGVRTEVRHPGSQTGRFRSHWHDEVAIRGLPADERVQARSPIEDRYCR